MIFTRFVNKSLKILMVTERLISMAALVIIGNKLSQLTVESCLMQREPKLILIAVKLKKALSLITQLKALNGNYDVTSKDFDEGKVAFLPMSLATYRTYKPYPYHIAKYSTFSWSCVTISASKKGVDATQVSTSLYAISSKTRHRTAAWEFLKLLCTDKETQQSIFDYSQGSSVLKSVMQSKASKEKLKEEGFGPDSLTVSTLDFILSQGITKPTFKTYNTVIGQADYLISKSIIENSVEKDLYGIQKTIEDNLNNK